MAMDIVEMIGLWDGSIDAFAKAVGVSRKTVYSWVAAGRVPDSRADGLHYRIIPKQQEKLKKLKELEDALDKEFGRPL